MTQLIFEPIADAIRDAFYALPLDFKFEAYRWVPGMEGLDSVPCAVIELPDFQRTGMPITGEAPLERQLGAYDYVLTYPVTIYWDLSNAVKDQSSLGEVVENFIYYVDQNPTLGLAPMVDEAQVTGGNVAYDLKSAPRPLVAYETNVAVSALVE